MVGLLHRQPSLRTRYGEMRIQGHQRKQLVQFYYEKSGRLYTFIALFGKIKKTNIQMKRNEPIYESPAVEVVLLQPDSAMLQASSAGASTQSLNEEDYEW